MRRNLILTVLLGACLAASVPVANARTADVAPINCNGPSDGRQVQNGAGGFKPGANAGCGTLLLCISDLAGNQGTGQFEVEGGGPSGQGYLLSKILNSFGGGTSPQNPDASATGNVSTAPNTPFTTDTSGQTSFPCVGSVNSANMQQDDEGISLPPGTYTIYGGKYNSANCLKTVNGHVVEQPGGGLVYDNPPQRCHGRVHHFHVSHSDGTNSITDNNETGTVKGIGMSVVEQDHMTVAVVAGQLTKVQAHMVDDRYPDCQATTSTTSPNRICEPTSGPTGPAAS